MGLFPLILTREEATSGSRRLLLIAILVVMTQISLGRQ
ncbi:LOW QUALITY PROTEIN: hypothetical protein TorRG33x02_358350 [Trema orientale]|uniref:Uncharacterized protein n=1 Tax=Trema orientale TaxID=63057 RepID=A0A2P5A3W3_TREOI|nr:LOW QUALITY PROTEIN: hypothetical protein TorRG33x02_358350 [Trema orientale]